MLATLKVLFALVATWITLLAAEAPKSATAPINLALERQRIATILGGLTGSHALPGIPKPERMPWDSKEMDDYLGNMVLHAYDSAARIYYVSTHNREGRWELQETNHRITGATISSAPETTLITSGSGWQLWGADQSNPYTNPVRSGTGVWAIYRRLGPTPQEIPLVIPRLVEDGASVSYSKNVHYCIHDNAISVFIKTTQKQENGSRERLWIVSYALTTMQPTVIEETRYVNGDDLLGITSDGRAIVMREKSLIEWKLDSGPSSVLLEKAHGSVFVDMRTSSVIVRRTAKNEEKTVYQSCLVGQTRVATSEVRPMPVFLFRPGEQAPMLTAIDVESWPKIEGVEWPYLCLCSEISGCPLVNPGVGDNAGDPASRRSGRPW